MYKYFAFSIVLLSFLTNHGVVIAQNSKPLFTAPLGVQAYTFKKSFSIDVAKTLDTIKLMGFVEIEGGGNGMSPVDLENYVMTEIKYSIYRCRL